MIKVLFFDLLLRIIVNFPSLLENRLVKRFIKIPFRHIVGKVGYDDKVNIDENYKEPFRQRIDKYLKIKKDQPREVLDLGLWQ